MAIRISLFEGAGLCQIRAENRIVATLLFVPVLDADVQVAKRRVLLGELKLALGVWREYSVRYCIGHVLAECICATDLAERLQVDCLFFAIRSEREHTLLLEHIIDVFTDEELF